MDDAVDMDELPGHEAAEVRDRAAEDRDAQSRRGPGGKKRKVALFVAYTGFGFSGMQHNPGARTVEGVLIDALHKAGCISDDNAGDYQKLGWMRAARTDKGVSAVGNVVSLKLMIDFPDLIERINNALPPQIRALGCERVTHGFDARKLCDRRRYEYILPAAALDPAWPPRLNAAPTGAAVVPAPEAHMEAQEQPGLIPQRDLAASSAVSEQLRNIRPTSEGPHELKAEAAPASAVQANGCAHPASQANGDAEPGHGGDEAAPEVGSASAGSWREPSEAATTEGAAGPCRMTREEQPGSVSSSSALDDVAVERLNALLGQFVGTHNFHNFTVRTPSSDPAASRYILSFACTGTFDLEGQRWVRLVVVGQSFMMHHVRKMVGSVLAIMRGARAPGFLAESLQSSADVPTPMAPELGLFLDECVFASYNARWGTPRGQAVALSAFQAAADAFKAEHIYPHIRRRDAEDSVFALWCQSLAGQQGTAPSSRTEQVGSYPRIGDQNALGSPSESAGQPEKKRKTSVVARQGVASGGWWEAISHDGRHKGKERHSLVQQFTNGRQPSTMMDSLAAEWSD